MKPEWILPFFNPDELTHLVQATGIDHHIVSILYSRGIKDPDNLFKYVSNELNYIHSPFLLDGIYDAVNRIKQAIKNHEKIAIFGDSDLDGITSLSIVYGVLEKAGCRPFIRYPKAKESYGLTNEVINEFVNNDIKLVITVDSGIRDIVEIELGRRNGLDFIVTDHHEPGSSYPDAIIINPKKAGCNYPYKDLAGVGVAFKLIHALLYSYTSSFNKIYILIYKELNNINLQFIKNGILFKNLNCNNDEICQVVTRDISGDNFVIFLNEDSYYLSGVIKTVHEKIIISNFLRIASSVTGSVFNEKQQMFNKLISDYSISADTKNDNCSLYTKLFIELHWRGLTKLISILQEYLGHVSIGTIADVMPLTGENRQLVKYGLSIMNSGKGHPGILNIVGDSEINTKVISWDIAPLLNAPGRMGESDLTVNFFLEKNKSKIDELINSIKKINRDRKKNVNDIIERIKNYTNSENFNDNIFFYMDNEILDGIAGLIANRISDDFNKPVIIATGADSNGIVKCSARSSSNFDFFSYTSSITHLFERIGGHAQAFGFTAKSFNINSIIEKLNYEIGKDSIPEKKISIDLEIKINEINPVYIKKLALLEPYGKSNEEPLFISRCVKIISFFPFGLKNNHGRFVIEENLQAIGWNMYDKMEFYFNKGDTLDLVYKLENNVFHGRTYPRIILVDLDFSF